MQEKIQSVLLIKTLHYAALEGLNTYLQITVRVFHIRKNEIIQKRLFLNQHPLLTKMLSETKKCKFLLK